MRRIKHLVEQINTEIDGTIYKLAEVTDEHQVLMPPEHPDEDRLRMDTFRASEAYQYLISHVNDLKRMPRLLADELSIPAGLFDEFCGFSETDDALDVEQLIGYAAIACQSTIGSEPAEIILRVDEEKIAPLKIVGNALIMDQLQDILFGGLRVLSGDGDTDSALLGRISQLARRMTEAAHGAFLSVEANNERTFQILAGIKQAEMRR